VLLETVGATHNRNDFWGIDLNFASSIEREKNSPIAKYILDDNSYFGGIFLEEIPGVILLY